MAILVYGTTYYRVTYADPYLTMPGLKPMVYLGKNLFGNETKDTHYFQDTVSVAHYGLLKEAMDKPKCDIYSCLEEDVGIDILSLDEAASAVSEAAEKAKKLGYPKLARAQGQWEPRTP